ncbi:MAG TPA: hypothetical protein VLK82_03135 [Candidatus Tectomicrobia bacterium]|nr:hypothetical protein [Candidatus Tectomicrobia bacterium]
MSRCLRDRTLWLLSEGEASGEARAHVASCAFCAARLRRLEQDLSHLRSALSGPPPSLVAPARRRPIHVRWMVPAAALAAMVVVGWFGLWSRLPSPPLPTEARQESIWPFIEGVSAALFSAIESGFTETAEELSGLADLQAALVGEWPCDEQGAFGDVACDEDTSALQLGEQ